MKKEVAKHGAARVRRKAPDGCAKRLTGGQ